MWTKFSPCGTYHTGCSADCLHPCRRFAQAISPEASSPAPEGLPEQRPWAVLALDVETHGWLDSTTRQPNHRGQFGKLRWGNVRDNLGFARVVQIGWCAFAANGDALERMELCISDAPPCHVTVPRAVSPSWPYR